MRVALYARTSTHDRQDPQTQIHELRNVAAQRGWHIVSEFIDTVTGSKARRPGLDGMLKECRNGKLDTIVATRLDRLARNLSNLIELVNELSSHNVALISLKENFDLSTSNGRLVFHLFGAISEFERGLISERIRAALSYARFRGVKIGRPSRMDQQVRSMAFHLRAKGESIRAVAKSLRISPSAVHKLLKTTQIDMVENTRNVATVSLGTEQKNS